MADRVGDAGVAVSVRRLQDTKAFVRMSSGLDLNKCGWYGDGSSGNGEIAKLLETIPGIVHEPNGALHFSAWNCRAGQNNVVIRTDGTVAPFPDVPIELRLGNIDEPKFDQKQLADMKKTCQRHRFPTLNHKLAYCYKDARVIKWLWAQVAKNKLRGGGKSFED